jgi:hypothetical protein
MTPARDNQSISATQLIVLSCLSSSKVPKDDELTAAVIEITIPDEPLARSRERTLADLAELRARGLVKAGANKLTDAGNRQLCTTFSVDRTPTWSKIRDKHIPALALGLATDSDDAKNLGQAEALTIALLRHHFELPRAATLTTLCDALIAHKLGVPAESLTLANLRSRVLAQHLHVEIGDGIADIATRAVRASLDDVNAGSNKDKPSLRQLLARRWVYQVTRSPGLSVTKSLPHAVASQAQLPGLQPTTAAQAPAKPNPPTDVSPETLLTLVREAIPRIGSDGRFGAEKVFVSAIWRRLESDRRLPNLSLDRFKRWLVTANRDQLLDLARADTRGEMDPRLLAESEIVDLGATFHFVVDRRAANSGRGIHAR